MPYDKNKDPFYNSDVTRRDYGTRGRNITLSTADVDLNPYAYVRVFAPFTVAIPVVRYVPVGNTDAAPVTLSLAPGQAEILPHPVRRLLGTANGTAAGLEFLTSEQ
ncbi:hypothetical protein J5J86_13890 [Aquabacter sp. L1I39]|uniref:hypothetical protein n=1 Tax=Aquabacter sp. L1I39 TaxID=2820278 RepID=UPI001ADCE30D|nr:hypothetical protein [Aquabacter sp. L1I39]QTL01897.1 hypothetical protein J5J86_13890 [Aquabacter sp. L1I39]